MMKSKKFAALAVAGMMLIPTLAFASPADENDGADIFRPVLTKEQVAEKKARVEAENAKAAPGTVFEWYSDEEYAAGLVPDDIAQRVIEPDDGFSSDSGE